MPVFEGGWFAPRPVDKVLLVDDDEATLKHWSRACTKSGKTALVARTVAEALALAAASQPDTAVIDFFLDDGKKAIDLVPQLTRLVPDIYIVVVSGKLHFAATELGPLMHAGAHDCLPKTMGLSAVLDGIEKGVRPTVPDSDELLTHDQLERMNLEHTLQACGYNITRAAESLGVSPPTVRTWIAKHGFELPATARTKTRK